MKKIYEKITKSSFPCGNWQAGSIHFTHGKSPLLILPVFLILLTMSVQGQDTPPVPKDAPPVIQDSVITGQNRSDVDSVIYTSAKDSLIFSVSKKNMDLYGSGNVRYKDTELSAGKVFIDFNKNEIEATGVKTDTSDELTESPVLSDKGEEYRGSRMRYNYKTTKGFITYAKTKEAETSYSGARIKKVTKDTYFVENGVYSTCDADEPHYFFYGTEMKVIQKEQLVGKWIWLAFNNVPFPIPLPFAVVPLESGRRSGFLAPAYGERQGFGKYFSRFGYFWALSDYSDVNLTADYYLKGGYTLNSRFRYAERYNYTGQFEASYSDLYAGEKTDPDFTRTTEYRANWNHNQTITPTSRFDANMQFMSGNFYRQTSADYNQLLTNDIYSNATYSKSWEEWGSSMSLNYSRRQNLESGDINEVLPSLYFTKSQFYPFRTGKLVSNQSWYEMIGVSYSGQLQNKRDKTDGELRIRGGMQHTASIGASPKIGYINISPSLNYREAWYNKQISKRAEVSSFSGNDTVVTDDVNKISMVRLFSLSANAATKLYGIFNANQLGVASIRHILQPSIGFSFQPDFSTDGWGYYDHYTLSDGTRVKYNKYEREIFGGASQGESRLVTMRLDNLFEMKTMVDPTDTTSKEKKIQLLNFGADLNYDIAADSLRFSDLRLSYRTQIGDLLNISGFSSYTFYDFVQNKGTINRFLASEGRGLMRLKSFSVSVSTTLSGDRLKPETPSGEAQEDNIPVEDPLFRDNNANYRGIYDVPEADFNIPWSLSLNYNYSLSKPSPSLSTSYSNISTNINFNLTKNWKFILVGSYDFDQKQFAAPQVTVSRDLHCWIMNFTWNPIGSYTGYRFEIRVKASQLQDLKITKTDRFFGGR